MQPQEVEVWYVLPAIRRELVKALKEDGLKQGRIAVLLGITDAAVSQYQSRKRAAGIVFDKEMLRQIKMSAKAIIKDNSRVMREIQRICLLCRKNKVICQIHMQKEKMAGECTSCFQD